MVGPQAGLYDGQVHELVLAFAAPNWVDRLLLGGGNRGVGEVAGIRVGEEGAARAGGSPGAGGGKAVAFVDRGDGAIDGVGDHANARLVGAEEVGAIGGDGEVGATRDAGGRCVDGLVGGASDHPGGPTRGR
jgi:hypothetical protein